MDEDREVLLKTLSSFDLYRPSLHSANQLRRADYISCNARHKALLPGYLAKLEAIDDSIALNADLVEVMLQKGSLEFLGEPWSRELRMVPSAGDLEKIRSTIKQLVRDWSTEVLMTRLRRRNSIDDETGSN